MVVPRRCFAAAVYRVEECWVLFVLNELLSVFNSLLISGLCWLLEVFCLEKFITSKSIQQQQQQQQQIYPNTFILYPNTWILMDPVILG